MNMPAGALDLGALKAQQDIEREAKACGMADHHPVVVGIIPGPDGSTGIQMILVGTCHVCKCMVRSEWWRKHKEDQHPEPVLEDTVEIGDPLFNEDGAPLQSEEASLLTKLGND